MPIDVQPQALSRPASALTARRTLVEAWHGTTARFDRFQPLTHFGSVDAAKQRLRTLAKHYGSPLKHQGDEAVLLYRVGLRIGRSLQIADTMHNHGILLLVLLAVEKGGLSEDEADRLVEPMSVMLRDKWKSPHSPRDLWSEEGDWHGLKDSALIEELRAPRTINEVRGLFTDALLAKGYDSLQYKNTYDDRRQRRSWIILDPAQVEIRERIVLRPVERGDGYRLQVLETEAVIPGTEGFSQGL